jgi:LmbE family N-acetylglucosaminyl deacetylase
MNVLVVAAHPDDEVIGAGGAMARHVAQGDRVHVLILGEGATSRYSRRQDAPKSAVRKLKTQSQRILKDLGVTGVFFQALPDNRFDSCDLLDIVKAVETVKCRVRPEVVYTHHSGDLNIDHRMTCQAVVTATRPTAKESVRKILAFEVPTATEWNFASPDTFMPNYFIDITRHLERKLKAVAAYTLESAPTGNPRTVSGLRLLAQWRGAQCGQPAAEAFHLLREIC